MNIDWIRPAALLTMMASLAGPAAADAPISYGLDTAPQIAVERKTLDIIDEPEIQKAGKEIAAIFGADTLAKTSAGRTLLDQAAMEHLYAAVFNAVADDPSRPKVLWILSPAHTWHGLVVPGSRYGVDNPDNIYRLISVDGAHEYRIRGRRGAGDPPAQYNFELLDAVHGTNSAPGMHGLGKQLAFLLDTNVRTEGDGSFTITVGPGEGGPNHIRTTPAARALIIRDTLSDWSRQAPNTLSVELVSGPVGPEIADAELVRKAAKLAPETARLWLDFRQDYYASHGHGTVNHPVSPNPRDGGWGYAAPSQLKLGPDEALVITITDLGARYLGFQIADPWMISQDYWSRSGAFNNSQAVRNQDGSITYVIARKNPGVANWIDATEMDEGSLLIRWQNLADPTVSPAGAVREVELVPVSTVAQRSGALRVDAASQSEALRMRAQSYARRTTEMSRQAK